MRGKRSVINPGDRYGRLTIIKEVQPHIQPSGHKERKFQLLCDCGGVTEVMLKSLREGTSSSCGCYHREISTTHGLYNHPLYSTWNDMKKRCYNPKMKRYGDYGGRGIKVCERWLENPQNFFDDMGEKPSPQHSIDRINNDGNYEPSNCKWSINSEQLKNRRPYKLKNKNMKT